MTPLGCMTYPDPQERNMFLTNLPVLLSLHITKFCKTVQGPANLLKTSTLMLDLDSATSRIATNHKQNKMINSILLLQNKDKDISRLEARATTAEGLLVEAKQKGEIEKGGALSSSLAAARKASNDRESELRKAMRDGETKLMKRVERGENENALLRRLAMLAI